MRVLMSLLMVVMLAGSSVSAAERAEKNGLPMGLGPVVSLPGGIAAVAPQFGVFIAGEDLTQWDQYLVREPNVLVDVVGGSLEHPVCIMADDKGARSLVRLSATAPPTLLTATLDSSFGTGTFWSEDLGCVNDRRFLRMTKDGGRTWSPRIDVVAAKEALWGVRKLKWLSADELIVSADADDGIALYDVKEGGLQLKWRVKLPEASGTIVPGGKGRIWLTGPKVTCVSTATGQVIGDFKAKHRFEGIEVDGQRLILFGDQGLGIYHWTEKPFAVVEDKWINSEWISGIAIRKNEIYALGSDGWLAKVDLVGGKLVRQGVKVIRLEKSIAPARPVPDVASPEQMKELMKLAMQVDLATRERILGAANKKTDLSPRERAIWATEELKRELKKGN